jgi:hypothetical protein|tara:strand:+ start:186 stop:374 length:189 start_codon:yes stop_codon:yes gene_type:complete
MSKRLGKSEEENIANKIADQMKDSTVDLDEVGKYLGRMVPSYLLNRLDNVVDSAYHERAKEL